MFGFVRIFRESSQGVEAASAPEISYYYYRISVSRDNVPSTFQYYESYKSLCLRDGRTKKNLREVIEPSRAPVNRLTLRFRCWFPFTVATCVCVCARDTNVAVYVYCARKLQRTFAACTGVRAHIRVVAKAAVCTCTSSFVETSVRIRIFLMRSVVIARKSANLHFRVSLCT